MATTAARSPDVQRRGGARWFPRQHGAWAILAVPLLLGVAASRASPWHLLLALTATGAYLAWVAGIEWARTRRPDFLRPAAGLGAVAAAGGIGLAIAHPPLAVVGGFVLAVGAVVLGISLSGRPKSLAVSLLEVAQALALVPAAAIVSGAPDGGAPDAGATADAMLAAGAYLFGSVLVVRSLIRERGNPRYLALSVAYHAAAVAAVAWLLPWPYAVLAVGLLVRAAALPAIQRRLAATGRRLRPIHVGVVEIVASIAIVLLGFGVGF